MKRELASDNSTHRPSQSSQHRRWARLGQAEAAYINGDIVWAPRLLRAASEGSLPDRLPPWAMVDRPRGLPTYAPD
jgi:hypothetical protein